MEELYERWDADCRGLCVQAIVEHGAYPSPLNYGGFPKSICSSVNEVIIHGIPDDRKLEVRRLFIRERDR